MGFLATLGALTGALIYIFILFKILVGGYEIASNFEDEWWGGGQFWVTWALFWLFGPPILIISAIQEFN